jgi:serine acetyltransferase
VKEVIRAACHAMARMLSCIISLRLLALAVRLRNRLFWYALERRFDKVGEASFIEYPVVTLGEDHITLGSNFYSYARLRLEAYDNHLGNVYHPEIIIGDNVSLNYDCHIACINRVVIGNNVLIGSKVHITDHSHGSVSYEALSLPPAKRSLVSKGPVIIEDNVWIGEGAVIMPNVRIGRNAIVGANAVVTKDVPANCVVGGVPARVIRYL